MDKSIYKVIVSTVSLYHHQNHVELSQDGQFLTVAVGPKFFTGDVAWYYKNKQIPIKTITYLALKTQIVITHCRNESTFNLPVLETDVRPFWASVLAQLFNQFWQGSGANLRYDMC